MSDERKKEEERVEEERWDDAKAGEHTYVPSNEPLPDYLQEFLDGLQRRDRPAK
jgi:hypothetical protein